MKVCTTPRGLEIHQASGNHHKFGKLTSSDKIRKIYTRHIEEGIAQVEGNMAGQDDTSVGQQEYILPCGWALKQASKRKPHNAEVRAYIQAIFDIGQATNEKANATKVAQDMRTATDDKGNLLFQEKHWLQPSQIKSLFGSMAKAAKKPGQKRLVSDTDFGQDDSDEDENEMLNHLMDNTTGMAHPVVIQQYINSGVETPYKEL